MRPEEESEKAERIYQVKQSFEIAGRTALEKLRATARNKLVSWCFEP